MQDQPYAELRNQRGVAVTFNFEMCFFNSDSNFYVQSFDEYRNISQKDIEDSIKGELSGHFEDLLLAVGKPLSVNKWNCLYFFEVRVKGAGTDEFTLNRIMVSRSEIDLLDIRREFKKHYGCSLYSAIQTFNCCSVLSWITGFPNVEVWCYDQVAETPKTTKEPIHKGLHYELLSKDSHCHSNGRSEVRTLSLGMQAVGRRSPEVLRAGELSQPLTGCITRESGLPTLTGQQNRAGFGSVDVDELALRA
uniref:Annexin A3 n=1 Tax=Rattus norvegicus TaxID=10116 RepID=Q6TXF2_RAT|nr:LRRGT00047 [Rattus norvegicus]